MHEGHRGRMRDRYLANEGFDGFSDYEFLEMLLYYGKPRGDTNPCAHELMERFGSIKALFEASVDELCTVDGVGLNSAILIKLINEAMRRYAGDMVERVQRYDTMSKVTDYLYRLFLGLDHERLYMLLFNDRLNLIDCVLLSKGSTNSSEVPMRNIVKKAVLKNATGVILAHNHPNGVAVPSESDLDVTEQIKHLLEIVDITLVEHFIIADEHFWPIMRRRYGVFRPAPVSDRMESYFYESFYDLDETEYRLKPCFERLKMKE